MKKYKLLKELPNASIWDVFWLNWEMSSWIGKNILVERILDMSPLIIKWWFEEI